VFTGMGFKSTPLSHFRKLSGFRAVRNLLRCSSPYIIVVLYPQDATDETGPAARDEHLSHFLGLFPISRPHPEPRKPEKDQRARKDVFIEPAAHSS